jgi:hypothetical protein
LVVLPEDAEASSGLLTVSVDVDFNAFGIVGAGGDAKLEADRLGFALVGLLTAATTFASDQIDAACADVLVRYRWVSVTCWLSIVLIMAFSFGSIMEQLPIASSTPAGPT